MKKSDFDIAPLILNSNFGPEPSLKEILYWYYRTYFSHEEATRYCNRYISNCIKTCNSEE